MSMSTPDRANPSSFPGSSWGEIVLEWLGRICAVGGAVVFVLTLVVIDNVRENRSVTKKVLDDFVTANNFFEPVDLGSATKAREQLESLVGVLGQLRQETGTGVKLLSDVVPDVDRLLRSAGTDLKVAQNLNRSANALAGTAGSLRSVAEKATDGAEQLDGLLARSTTLVRELNAVLAEMERKLDNVPSTGGG